MKLSGGKSDSNMPIFINRDLTKQQGDKLTFPLVLGLSQNGILGSTGKALKGNEEKLQPYAFSVELEEYAHAVADKNPLGRKRVMFNVPATASAMLMDWGSRLIDRLIIKSVEGGTVNFTGGSQTFSAPTNIIYGGSATATSNITASDKLTLALLQKLRVRAATRNDGGRFKIRPVKIEGRDYYVALCHPDILYDLKQDTDFKTYMQQARERSADHPIFRGATAITADGIVLHEHEDASIFTNWGSGSNVAGGYVTLFGAQAVSMALGVAPHMETEYEDYGRQVGNSYQMIMGIARSQFNSMDYGVAQLRVARTQIADA